MEGREAGGPWVPAEVVGRARTSSQVNCIHAYSSAEIMKKMMPPVKHASVKR